MNPTHIIQLQAENVKRLRAVNITPSGRIIVVGGANGEGKSSLLDSIAMGLGGKDQIPPEPVRRGARKAIVILDLGDIVVKRTFRPNGGTSLTVEGKDGTPFSSPQAVLDRLTTQRTFDPLAFLKLGEDSNGRRKQADTLRGVAKLDFTELDAQRAEIVAKRADVNRELEREKARTDSIPEYPDAPKEEVSVVELAAQIEAALAHNRLVDSRATDLEDAEDFALDAAKAVEQIKQVIAKLEKEMAEARTELAKVSRANGVAQDALIQAKKVAQEAAGTRKDLAPLRQQLAEADSTNKAVAANRARTDAERLVTRLLKQSEKMTSDLEDIDEIKRTQLAGAKLPIPDLGFTEDGILYKGLPLEQASQAEQMRVSVAIAAALNPTLRVMLVRDGSLLDEKSLARLALLADEFDLQVWLERVGHGPECSVVISDGAVEGAADEAAEELGPEEGGDR